MDVGVSLWRGGVAFTLSVHRAIVLIKGEETIMAELAYLASDPKWVLSWFHSRYPVTMGVDRWRLLLCFSCLLFGERVGG